MIALPSWPPVAMARLWNVRRNNNMFLNFGMLVQAILLALGIWWCKEIFSRWRDDVVKMREPDDRADRAVIIIFWSITVLVLLLCVRFVFPVAQATASPDQWSW